MKVMKNGKAEGSDSIPAELLKGVRFKGQTRIIWNLQTNLWDRSMAGWISWVNHKMNRKEARSTRLCLLQNNQFSATCISIKDCVWLENKAQLFLGWDQYEFRQESSAKLTNQRVSYAFTCSPLSLHSRHILPASKFQYSYCCILLIFYRHQWTACMRTVSVKL